jgi:hypothetical protein
MSEPDYQFTCDGRQLKKLRCNVYDGLVIWMAEDKEEKKIGK